MKKVGSLLILILFSLLLLLSGCFAGDGIIQKDSISGKGLTSSNKENNIRKLKKENNFLKFSFGLRISNVHEDYGSSCERTPCVQIGDKYYCQDEDCGFCNPQTKYCTFYKPETADESSPDADVNKPATFYPFPPPSEPEECDDVECLDGLDDCELYECGECEEYFCTEPAQPPTDSIIIR